MPQDKINILSTRELPQVIIQKALEQNIFVDIFPFIKTEILQDDFLKRRIRHYAHHHLKIVFTSANAVEAVAENLENKNPGWRIFCVGDLTKKLIEKHFDKNTIAGNADTATDLANVIIENKNIFSVIFFCGDRRRNELPEKLRKRNIEVNEVSVYKTIETPISISKKYDGILFYSPSAASSFFSVNKIDDTTVLFAIGNTTANEIKKFSSNKILVAKEPSKEILVEEAINFFDKNHIHN